jgi:hypothetical protein
LSAAASSCVGRVDRIEHHTVGFVWMQDKLRSAKRHLKCDLLLYDPRGELLSKRLIWKNKKATG